jgi:hypothetical protein
MTLNNMGLAHYKTGQLAQAIDCLAQAVELEKEIQPIDLAEHQARLVRWKQELAKRINS